MSNNRFEYIDLAKGIGIILVVLFHIPNIEKLPLFRFWGGWITTFYMPLFFILSGLFFNSSNPFKKIKKLLTPYICFFIIGWVIEALKVVLKRDTIQWESILYPFYGHTLGYANPPIWFLLSLAEIFLISHLLTRYLSPKISFTISILVGIGGYILGKNDIFNSYYLSTSFLCLPFYLGGYYFKDFIMKPRKHNGLYGSMLFAFSIICYIPNTPFVNVSQCYIEGILYSISCDVYQCGWWHDIFVEIHYGKTKYYFFATSILWEKLINHTLYPYSSNGYFYYRLQIR